MKKLLKMCIIAINIYYLTVSGVLAEGHSMKHAANTMPPQMDDSPQGYNRDKNPMDHSHKPGNHFRNAVVNGYHLTYDLMDLREKMIKMKPADPPYTMTHHLMVFVKDADGRPINSAKVGYLVIGPTNETQKLMCMAMAGGYGADINFTAPGTYTVKTKVMVGKQSILDSFTYDIK